MTERTGNRTKWAGNRTGRTGNRKERPGNRTGWSGNRKTGRIRTKLKNYRKYPIFYFTGGI